MRLLCESSGCYLAIGKNVGPVRGGKGGGGWPWRMLIDSAIERQEQHAMARRGTGRSTRKGIMRRLCSIWMGIMLRSCTSKIGGSWR